MKDPLVSITVSRRSISVAVFRGRTIEYTDVINLPDSVQKGCDAATRFLRWIIEDFAPTIVALGDLHADEGRRVQLLNQTVEDVISSAQIPAWRVATDQLLESYGVPRLESKIKLREIAQSFWPQLSDAGEKTLEAAALGFYVQVERLLST